MPITLDRGSSLLLLYLFTLHSPVIFPQRCFVVAHPAASGAPGPETRWPAPTWPRWNISGKAGTRDERDANTVPPGNFGKSFSLFPQFSGGTNISRGSTPCQCTSPKWTPLVVLVGFTFILAPRASTARNAYSSGNSENFMKRERERERTQVEINDRYSSWRISRLKEDSRKKMY